MKNTENEDLVGFWWIFDDVPDGTIIVRNCRGLSENFVRMVRICQELSEIVRKGFARNWLGFVRMFVGNYQDLSGIARIQISVSGRPIRSWRISCVPPRHTNSVGPGGHHAKGTCR